MADQLAVYSLEQHRRHLAAREQEVLAAMSSASARKLGLLEQELAHLREMLADLSGSHAEMRQSLTRRLTMLSKMHNQVRADKLRAAQSAMAMGDTSAASDLFAAIEAEQSEAVGRAADAARQQALIALESVRFIEARAHIERAAGLAPDNYEILRDAATVMAACGDVKNRLRYETAAVRAAKDTYGLNSAETAESLSRLASVYQSMGGAAEAERLFLRALDIDIARLGENHPHIAARLNNIANLYRDQGRSQEAEEMLLRAIAIGEGGVGADHPEYAIWLNNLAGLYRSMGRLEEAEPLMIRALDITRRAYGETHPSTAIRLNNLAGLRRAMGRFDDAEKLYLLAIRIDKAALGPDHPDLAIDLNNLGLLYEAVGRLKDARRVFEQAGKIFAHRLGGAHQRTRQAAENIDRVDRAMLRFDPGGGQAAARRLRAAAVS